MVYRKGERTVPRPLDRWRTDHPVARVIETGDRWFYAWQSYKATPTAKLARLTGIPPARLLTIEHGGPISRAELDGLSRAWSVSTGDLIASMGGAVEIIE
jgi:hypothetical protein